MCFGRVSSYCYIFDTHRVLHTSEYRELVLISDVIKENEGMGFKFRHFQNVWSSGAQIIHNNQSIRDGGRDNLGSLG